VAQLQTARWRGPVPRLCMATGAFFRHPLWLCWVVPKRSPVYDSQVSECFQRWDTFWRALVPRSVAFAGALTSHHTLHGCTSSQTDLYGTTLTPHYALLGCAGTRAALYCTILTPGYTFHGCTASQTGLYWTTLTTHYITRMYRQSDGSV
jgi:hypothetical protein